VVSGIVEHPESGFFDQVPVGMLSQVLMKWVHKAGNILLESSKMTWLAIISLVSSKWSSPLRNFLMMEQMLRPLSVPGKFMRSGKSSLVSFRLGVLGMITVADKTDAINMILSSCHCFLNSSASFWYFHWYSVFVAWGSVRLLCQWMQSPCIK